LDPRLFNAMAAAIGSPDLLVLILVVLFGVFKEVLAR
jgi:hypothetical protein